MPRRKKTPSWAKTNVPWELKIVIWERMALGENDSQVSLWLELNTDKQDTSQYLERETIARVRNELKELPEELAKSLPELIQTYWKELSGRDRGLRTRPAHRSGLGTIIAEYAQKKSDHGAREDLLKFIDDWAKELHLPLNYLDVGDPLVLKTGLRHLGIEDRDEFKDLKKAMPNHLKLWKPFEDCQKLGGLIIKACAELAVDIRKQSETRTGLKIVDSFNPPIQGSGLDKFFAWTVYADALGILVGKWVEREYRLDDAGNGLFQISWGDDRIAILKSEMKDAVVSIHSELRAIYKKSKTVNNILQWKLEFDSAQAKVLKELDRIRQRLEVR